MAHQKKEVRRRMTSDKFTEVISDRIKKCFDTLGVKANEYATSDRLHNFKERQSIVKENICKPHT